MLFCEFRRIIRAPLYLVPFNLIDANIPEI